MLKVFVYIISLCCILQACSVFEDPEEFTLVNIDDNYIIELSQTLQVGPNALLFNIQSIQTDNCIDSHIDVESNIVQNQLQLILGDIVTQEPCQKIQNQLESSAVFALKPRDYRLNISLKDVTQNFGIVYVSEENFFIDLETENGIIIDQQKVSIIPDGYIWGSITMSKSQDLLQLKNLMDHLESMTQPNDLGDGDYSFFEIKNGSLILSDESTKNLLEEQFIFKQKSKFDVLKISLSHFAEQYPNAKIEVLNSIGESFIQ